MVTPVAAASTEIVPGNKPKLNRAGVGQGDAVGDRSRAYAGENCGGNIGGSSGAA